MKSSLLLPHETVNSKKRIRSVTFDTDLTFRGSNNVKEDAAVNNDGWNNAENNEMEENGQTQNIEMERAEMAKAEMLKMVTRSKNHLKSALSKLEKERDQKINMTALHNAKVQEMDIECEQLVLRAKIAQDSEAIIRKKYSKIKSTYHQLTEAGKESDETVKELKETINSMERLKEQQNATISGLKLCVEELAQPNPSNAQLE